MLEKCNGLESTSVSHTMTEIETLLCRRKVSNTLENNQEKQQPDYSDVSNKLINNILRNTHFSSPTEILIERQEFVVDGVTYRMILERVSEQEILQRIVLDWLDNLESPIKAKMPFPPKFEDREKVNGKKLNEREFFETTYAKFIPSQGIYMDQLRKLDKQLLTHIHDYYDAEELENILPTKTKRIDKNIQKVTACDLKLEVVSGLDLAMSRRKLK